MLTLLASCLLGLAQIEAPEPRPIRQLVHTRWTARDGAPGDIQALAQTSDGYLWLGTRSGLVRFDGVRFVHFAPRGGDSIPSGGVSRLTAGRDGSLWIVFRSGIVGRVRDGRLTSYGPQHGLPAAFQVAESNTGALVAGTAGGLSRFTGGRWEDASPLWQFPGASAHTVWFDRSDALWVQTEDRVVYLPAGGLRFVDPGMLLGRVAGTFAEARDGTIWFSEVQHSAHTVPRLGDRRPLTEVLVGSANLLVDRHGSLWIGTVGDGLRRVIDPARISGRRVAQFGPEAEQFTEDDGLLSNVTRALLEDREGNIWVGSSRGLERFRAGAFTPFATPGGIRPRMLFHTRDSSVWTAGYSVYGLVRLGHHGRETIMDSSFFMSNLAQDGSGGLWTVYDAGIHRLQGRRFRPVPLRRSDVRNLIDITIDPAGTVWVLDEQHGLLRRSGDSLIQVVPVNEPRLQHAFLVSDRAGRIWVGQRRRVALVDRGRVSWFGAAEGVGSEVNAFHEDGRGDIWIGTDEGLSRFDGGRFRALPGHQSLPGRTVYGIAADDVGAWWIVTPAGVHRLEPGEAGRALADSSHQVRYRSFDLLDGLPGMVSSSPYGLRVTRSADGRIWVATDNGVASVDPRQLPPPAVPHVLIEAARVDGRELDALDAVAVSPGSTDIEIDYTATLLSMPERVQFRYRLAGTDHAWHDVGTRRRAYYAGLAPGRYRFEAAAHGGDGTWSEVAAALDFRILPAWHQALWFRAAAILLTGALVAGAGVLAQRRRHLRSQEALSARYEATLTERARIAQDLHDTLLQGFAGVTLQLKAAELALPEEPDVAAETILRVQELARSSLREARERVWDMRGADLGGHDLPEALETLARDRVAGTGIAIALVTSGERQQPARHIADAAFRIGREAIVNAVRHAAARRIEIVVAYGPAAVCLEVRDDGHGFSPVEGEEARRQGHFGLSGIRERAARAGGRCEVVSRPGGGTVVALTLPYA